jgi:acyl carrier protein
MSSVVDEVRETVADVFALDVQDVTASTSPETTPVWDSIGHLNLVLALEQRFDVSFDPEQIPQLVSVQAIADVVAERQR